MPEIDAPPTVACPHCRLPVLLVARPSWGSCLHCNGAIKVSATGVAEADTGPRSQALQAEHLINTRVRVTAGDQQPQVLVYAGLQWQNDGEGRSEEWLTLGADGDLSHSLESGGLYIGNRWRHFEILDAGEVQHQGADRIARGIRFVASGEGMEMYWLRNIRGLVPVQRRVNDVLKVEWFSARRASGELWLGWVRDGARSYWQWLEDAPRPRAGSRRALISTSRAAGSPAVVPTPAPHHWTTIGSVALAVLIVIAALLSLLEAVNRHPLYSSSEVRLDEKAAWLSEPFTITGHVGHVEAEMQGGGMNNQWLETLLCLVNQKSAERRCLTIESWYYSGVEDGYPWQEDQLTARGYFSQMQAGEYRLEAHAFTNAPHPSYRLRLTQAASRYNYLGWALWLLTLPLVLRALFKIGGGEQQQVVWIVALGAYGGWLWALW